MSDTSTVWDTANSRGDWVLVGAVLQNGGDLATAVLISLFTDRIADPSDVIPDGTANPRGWIGDLDAEYPIGSRLWLLDRSKETAAVRNAAYQYVLEALQWMLDDSVVSKFDVTVEWQPMPGELGIQVVAYQTGGAISTFNYSWAWKGQQ